MRRFLEECHARRESVDAWLTAISRPFGAVASPHDGAMFTLGVLPRDVRVGWAHGFAERLGSMTNHANAPPEYLEKAYRPFLVTRLTRQFRSAELRGLGPFDAALDLGLVDAIGLMARDGPTVLVASIPVREGRPRSDREPLLYRLRRHLQAGFLAQRATPIEEAVAVATPGGCVVHAPPSLTRDGRALLRAAAAAYDDERRGKEPDAEAERVWSELFAGGWAVVESVDTDGKRMILLRRDPTADASSIVSPREARALALLSRGASHKLIAGDLGCSTATVRTLTTKALAKVGFRSRVDFARHVSATSASHRTHPPPRR